MCSHSSGSMIPWHTSPNRSCSHHWCIIWAGKWYYIFEQCAVHWKWSGSTWLSKRNIIRERLYSSVGCWCEMPGTNRLLKAYGLLQCLATYLASIMAWGILLTNKIAGKAHFGFYKSSRDWKMLALLKFFTLWICYSHFPFLPFLLDCNHGDIRLTSSASSVQGRVELCYDGVWGKICSSGWGKAEATVVCRQLGFSSEGIDLNVLTKSIIAPMVHIYLQEL